jgi:hypothetical protein
MSFSIGYAPQQQPVHYTPLSSVAVLIDFRFSRVCWVAGRDDRRPRHQRQKLITAAERLAARERTDAVAHETIVDERRRRETTQRLR